MTQSAPKMRRVIMWTSDDPILLIYVLLQYEYIANKQHTLLIYTPKKCVPQMFKSYFTLC